MALVLGLTSCDALTSPQHRLARAQQELDSGQWGRAAIDLSKLVQRDPHNAAAWLLLARLALDAGDPRTAQANLQHATTAGARGADVDTLRARIWLATGQAQALVEALSRHELSGIGEPDRTVLAARAQIELRRAARAEALLAPLLERQPKLTEARLALADAFASEGKFAEALAQLERVLAADPNSTQASAARGALLEQRGQLSAAEGAFAQALQHMSGRTPLSERLSALVGLTETRLGQGQIELAAQSQAILAKLAPGAASTQLLGARLKLARADTLGGIADLQALVAHAPNFFQAQLLLGTAEMQQGNLGQAEEALQQAVQLAPDNVQARELLASVQLRLNQPQAAMHALTPALSEQPADRQLLSLLGAVETRSGTPDAMLQELEHDLQQHPQDRTMRLNLAEAYLGAGRAPQALTLLQGTEEIAGDTRRDGLLIVAISILQGSEAATRQVEKLLAVHPNDPHVLNLAATYFAVQGQLARAHGLLQRALEINSHDASTFVALSQVEAAEGDLATAEVSLRNALAIDSASAPLRIALSDLLIARKAYSDADKVLAPLGGPQAGPQVQFALARLALARGDLSQANAALDRAVAQQPKSAALVNDAADVLMRANQYQAALARYTRAAELSADNPLYWLNSGRAQLALKQTSAARASFQKALQLRARWLPAVSALVLTDLQAKDFASARSRVNELLASQPDDVDALALAGDVQWAAGQFAEAQSSYGKAQQRHPSASLAAKLFRTKLMARESNPEQPLLQWLTLQPNDRSVRTLLGSYYLGQHSLQQAAAQFQAILELAPSDLVALNDLAWIDAELHDAHAEALAERAYQLAPAQPNVLDTFGWILAREGKTERAVALLAQAAKADVNDPNVQYHYAYALVQQGRRAEAQQILSTLLEGKGDFDSRRDAERLLASTRS